MLAAALGAAPPSPPATQDFAAMLAAFAQRSAIEQADANMRLADTLIGDIRNSLQQNSAAAEQQIKSNVSMPLQQHNSQHDSRMAVIEAGA